MPFCRVQHGVGPVVTEFGDGTWSFEQHLQLEREKPRARELSLPLVLLIVLIKAAVLKPYELVSEAYRHRFRSWKSDKQIHVEFVQDISTHFSRWCSASGVDTYDSSIDSIVLEQFKSSVPAHLATYINKRRLRLHPQLQC